MEQINYEKEIEAAIDNGDEEAFKKLFVDNSMDKGYCFKFVGFIKFLSGKFHTITEVCLLS